jgi:hypothetical protein
LGKKKKLKDTGWKGRGKTLNLQVIPKESTKTLSG